MTALREAAQQALDALEHSDKDSFWREQRDAITALSAALAEQPTMNERIRADMTASRESFYKRADELLDERIAAAKLAEQPAASVVLTLEQIDQISNGVNGVYINGWPLSQRESRRLFAERILAAAIPPGHCVVPVEPSEEQVDATRQILLYYDTQGRTYEGLRQFLDHAGVDYKSWCPEWFKTETGHMTKGGTAIFVYAAMLAARPGGEG